MGRKNSLVRQHCTVIDGILVCNYCEKAKYKNNSTRMVDHFLSCPAVPKLVRALFDNSADDNNVSGGSDVELVSEGASATKKPKASHNPSSVCGIFPFVQRLDKNQQEYLQKIWARFIYSAHLPFETSKNPYLKQFLDIVAPAFYLPSPWMLSNTLLEDENSDHVGNNSAKFASANVLGIVTDGWSTPGNDSIINFVFTTPEPVFIKSILTKDVSKTGAFITDQICKILTTLSETEQRKVKFYVTDNAPAMKLAWRLLMEERPNITAYGCAAHALNLLVNDMLKMPAFNKLTKLVLAICRAVKRKQLLYATYKLLCKEKFGNELVIILPSLTRWGSFFQMFQRFFRTKIIWRTLAVQEKLKEALSTTQVGALLSEDFWLGVERVIQVICPVSLATFLVEADDPRLGAVFFLFYQLKQHVQILCEQPWLTQDEKNELREAVQARHDFSITMLHKPAYFLDPKFRGEHLTEQEVCDLQFFIQEFGESLGFPGDKIIDELASYRDRLGKYSLSNLWSVAQRCSQTYWWSKYVGIAPLAQTAAIIAAAPATNASVERSFKQLKKVYSLERSRLSFNKAEKLLRVSSGLKYDAKKPRTMVGNHEDRWGKEKYKIIRNVAVQDVDGREAFETAVVRCEEFVLNELGIEEEAEEIDVEAELEFEDFEFEF